MDSFNQEQIKPIDSQKEESCNLTSQKMVSEIIQTISSKIIEVDKKSLGVIEYKEGDKPSNISPEDLITYYTKSIRLKPNTEERRKLEIPYYGTLNFNVDIDKENPTPNDIVSTLILTKAVLDTRFPVLKGKSLDTLEKPLKEYSRDELLEKIAPSNEINNNLEEAALKDLLIDTYPTLREDVKQIENQLEYVLQNPYKFKQSFEKAVKEDKKSTKDLKKCFQYLLKATPTTIVILTLLANSITSCSKTETNAMASEPIPYSESDSSILQWDEVASELIAEMEQLPTDTYILPEDIDLENEKSIQVSADITENVEFNNEIINIENWKNYNIETKETLEPGYTIETTTNTPIYLLPIHKDLFVNQKEEILQMEIPSGQNFEIAEKVVLHGDSNEQITFGILANTFGSKIVASIVLDAKDKNEIKKEFASFRENAENTVTYIALPEDIYPNKIQNVIRSMAYISQYQELNGPFQKDKEYSYLDIIGLENPQLKREYAQGLTISKAVVRAGGVCAGATALSTLIHQHDGNNVKIVEQWSQPAEYFQGAFSPSEDLVDAIVDQSEKENHDFRWIQQDNLYIETDVTLIPVNKPLPDPLEKPSDNTLVLSLSFTRDLPENQSSHLLHTLDNYISYREQFLNSNNSEVLKSRVIAHEPNIKNHNAFSMLYNPEDLSIFEHEISQDPILQEILTLQEIVNSYSPDSEVSLSEYLKNTDWYTNIIQTRNKDAVDTALRIISYTQIDGQPLQCIGYVSMLSLIYPELNIINASGAPIKIAKELIPQDAIEYSGNRVAIFPSKYTGGTIHTAKNIPISYYKRGDLFLTSNGYAGHIGVILDKTVKENGEVVLLVSDSNRSVDGKIKTFRVTEDNITEIFGTKRYILRKYEMNLSFIQEDITLSQLVKV